MKFDEEFFNLGYIDRLSYGNSFIHSIEPRSKVLVTMAFIITVVSFSKYEVLKLFPFFIFPVIFLTVGNIPILFVLKRLLIVSPFALFIGIFNPIFDRETAFYLFDFAISKGFLSFFSIMLRFTLTISILVLLIATTSFSGVCYALRRFRVPELFINQLLFLYRYIFVLVEESMRMARAKELRTFGKKGTEIKYFVNLIGNLLIRTMDRAERIYHAMLSRGFNGIMPYNKNNKLNLKDFIFITVSFLLLFLFRCYDVAKIAELIAVKGF